MVVESFSFNFSVSSRWHHSAQKGPYALFTISQQCPQSCPRNSANICLVEHRLFSTFEGRMSVASFLHSAFFQAISAVMLWPVHAQKVPQSSEHLYPAKLQSRCKKVEREKKKRLQFWIENSAFLVLWLRMKEERLFVCWLLNVPVARECISGMDLLRQFYMLPHWDRSCRSNFPSHSVTVYWHRANESQHWPYITWCLAG